MTTIETLPDFWIYGGILILLLSLIIFREFFYVWRSRHFDTRRVPHLFNIFILLLLVLVVCYGIKRFEAHRDRFESVFLSYPSAHYKADRQSLQFGNDWVYVTDDPPDAVISFYEAQAEKGRYALIVNKATSTSRLMFQKDGERLFLTIFDENNTRVLHYGENGSVITY